MPGGPGGQAAPLSDGGEEGHDTGVTMPPTLSCVRVTGCTQGESERGEPG